jgi:hypothetical protein
LVTDSNRAPHWPTQVPNVARGIDIPAQPENAFCRYNGG